MGRTAFDNTDLSRATTDINLKRLQLLEYWRNVHVRRRKLVYDHSPILPWEPVLLLSRKIQLETAYFLVELDQAPRGRFFQVERENLHSLLISLKQ